MGGGACSWHIAVLDIISGAAAMLARIFYRIAIFLAPDVDEQSISRSAAPIRLSDV